MTKAKFTHQKLENDFRVCEVHKTSRTRKFRVSFSSFEFRVSFSSFRVLSFKLHKLHELEI